jgi:hypothetical protein
MKKKKLIIYLLMVSYNCFSQNKQLPQKQIQIIGGRSFNGSGDISGISFTTDYTSYFRKRFSWSMGLNGTIHFGSYPNFFNDSLGNPVDGSIRETTAGVQIVSHLNYSLLKTRKHEVRFRVGGLLRFQSSSIPDVIIVYFPAGTGLPVPVNILVNNSKQNVFTLGPSLQIAYSLMISRKISIGALAGFQFDTNADHISQTSLTIGRHF